MPSSDKVVLGVFYTLIMAGQIILILCLLTVAVARLQRDLPLVNAAISMIIFSTACLLLLYANLHRGPEPPFHLCLTQACLIYGSLSMAASSVLSLFFQLWSGMRGTLTGTDKPWVPLRTALRLLPWILFVAMSIGCLIDGLHHPDEVLRSRDFFYCSASWRIGHAGSIVCGLCILASVLLEVHVVYMLIYVWRAPISRRVLLPVDSIVRLWLFSVYGGSCVIIAIIVMQFPTGLSPRYPFLFLSSLPLAMWLIFWTQKDVLRIWTSCCRRRNMTSSNARNSEAQQRKLSQTSLSLAKAGTHVSKEGDVRSDADTGKMAGAGQTGA